MARPAIGIVTDFKEFSGDFIVFQLKVLRVVQKFCFLVHNTLLILGVLLGDLEVFDVGLVSFELCSVFLSYGLLAVVNYPKDERAFLFTIILQVCKMFGFSRDSIVRRSFFVNITLKVTPVFPRYQSRKLINYK